MQEFFRGAVIVMAYFAIAASSALALRSVIRIPDEIFRKILHFILLISYLVNAHVFDIWWHSVLLTVALEILIYPILACAEHFPQFSAFVTERKAGELKSSLLLAFSMLALCNTVCWGILEDKYFGIACMYAWGVGDAFAALFGKRFGRHKISWKYADHNKSIEGSAAMFLTSELAVLSILLLYEKLPLAGCLIISAAGAAVSTVTEMISRKGMDTVCCPVSAMVVMIPLMALFGGFV